MREGAEERGEAAKLEGASGMQWPVEGVRIACGRNMLAEMQRNLLNNSNARAATFDI